MASETTRSNVLLNEFFHLHPHDEPEITINFFASLHDIVIEGEVEIKMAQLFVTLVELLDEEYGDEGQTLKRIVDLLCMVCVSWKDNRKLVVPEMRLDTIDEEKLLFHFEHQHRNDFKMPARLLVYLGMLMLKYPKYRVLQFLVYTGDEPFTSHLPFYGGTAAMVPLIIDLTQIDPEKVMNHPSIHIQILIIFNHRIDAKTKAAFLVKLLEEVYAKEGHKRLNYYYSLIIRGTTMQNKDALTLMEEELANSPHIHNELLDNPFYVLWTAKGEARGEARGRVNSALNLMKNMKVNAKRAAELLGFSAEESEIFYEYLAKINHESNGEGKD